MNVVILGCGYTGERVARRFLNRGASVTVTTRHPARLLHLEQRGAVVRTLDLTEPRPVEMPPGSLVLHSIPPLPASDPTPLIFSGSQPARVVYLSTTGVYGDVREVNEDTPAAPNDSSSLARMAVEDYVESGAWSSLILRPAAIYGPGRGVHERIRRGDAVPASPDVYVSRIHVDDLAAHVEAALLTRVTGRFPVADDEPCTSQEIAEFCARLLGVTVTRGDTLRANRRVDGSAIRNRLGLQLTYPSYRVGIPACLAVEAGPEQLRMPV